MIIFFFFQAEDGIRDRNVTGVQTCALPISARSPATFQPSLPRLTGTMVSIALPSLAVIGPATWLASTPGWRAKLRTSAAALARSAAVTPEARSYTTTAGNTLGEMNLDCRLRTLVDSAW